MKLANSGKSSHKHPIKKTFVVLLIIFIITILLLVYSVNKLSKTNATLSSQITTLNEHKNQLNNQISNLNHERDELMVELDNQKQKIQTISQQLSDTSNKLQENQDLLDEFKNDVQDSIEWFKTNSNLNNFNQYNRIIEKVIAKCVYSSKNTCTIKLGCFRFVHEHYYDFGYKPDIESSNKTDKLQSLGEFYTNKGGDCEDYSLLVNAELNYIRDFCEARNSNTLILEGMVPSNNNGFYYIDFQEDWGYDGGFEKYEIFNYDYNYIVCGYLPDVNNPYSDEGHCAIIFTNTPINTAKDVPDSLKSGIIFEPQTGQIISDLRYNSEISILQNGKFYSVNPFYYISAVISENDYYLFRYSEGNWRGYSTFLDEIKSID